MKNQNNMLFLQGVDIKTAIYQVKQWKKVEVPYLTYHQHIPRTLMRLRMFLI